MLTGSFLFLASIGFIAPNAAALALINQAHRAGAASALMGTMLLAIGALSGVAVTLLNDGSAQPLISVMATCGVCTVLVYYTAAWRRSGD